MSTKNKDDPALICVGHVGTNANRIADKSENTQQYHHAHFIHETHIVLPNFVLHPKPLTVTVVRACAAGHVSQLKPAELLDARGQTSHLSIGLR